LNRRADGKAHELQLDQGPVVLPNNSLSREKEIGMKVCFLFLTLLLLPSVRLSAAEPTEPTLPPVFVSSSRLLDVAEPTTQVPGKVIVVTSEEIEKLGAKTVQEVLQYQSGVVLYDSVGNEFQQTVDMRGFNAHRLRQPASSSLRRVNEPDFSRSISI
jgi:hypothetical protein